MVLNAFKVLISGLAAAAWLIAAPASWAQEETEGEDIVVAVTVELSVSGAALADALASQKLVGNVLVDGGSRQINAMDAAFNNTHGIIQVNQNSGSLVNQANLASIAIGDVGLAMATATSKIEFSQNDLTVMEGAIRENHIVDSFNNTSGIVMVNQNAGNMNQTANVIAIAIGVGPVMEGDEGFISLGDAWLDTVAADNNFNVDAGTTYDNDITDSFQNFHGVAAVTQVAGDGNIVANNIAISVNVVTGQ